MYAPSEPNWYRTPWKCIECGRLFSVSRFRKWTSSVSPTRARMSGPWMPSSPAALPTGFAKSFVYCR